MKPSKKSSAFNRRDFIKTTSLAVGAVAFGVPTLLRGQNLNSKLNIAAIGVGGKGASDTNDCATENIFALCDVDSTHAGKQLKKYPDAKFYSDFRIMFDEVGKSIDAVNVATPDHVHAIAASTAMQLGKHVYCQKPLTQTIYEARYLKDLARDKKLVTQMGNQGSAADGLRRAVECLQSGIIGQVSQVHIWTSRPIWPQAMSRPVAADPIPGTLNWDLWIGPAAMRPFNNEIQPNKRPTYQPFNWRGWKDFGTGALGDMACHTVNMPFRGLNLINPTEIESETFGVPNPETYPIGSKIRFEFPARKFSLADKTVEQSPVTLWWYEGGQPLPEDPTKHDGSNKPPRELTTDIEVLQGEIPGSGALLIGDQGTIFSPDDYGTEFFIKLKDDKKFYHYTKHPAVPTIAEFIPRNPFKGGTDLRHHQEWITAIKANKPEDCYSRFAVASQLAEIVLLGCVALRAGKKIEWDAPNLRVTNGPEAEAFIKRKNRGGWSLA